MSRCLFAMAFNRSLALSAAASIFSMFIFILANIRKNAYIVKRNVRQHTTRLSRSGAGVNAWLTSLYSAQDWEAS